MLKGNRILLRSVEKRDITIFYDIWSDEEVRKFDAAYLIPPSKEFLMENFNTFMNSTKKYLSIINEKNVLIGYITYEENKQINSIYTLGITIGRGFWDRAYGVDAITTLLRYLFLNKNAHRVELEVADYNERAIRCYSKCGFLEEGRKRKVYFSQGKFSDVVIMGILKDEYYKYNSLIIEDVKP